MKLVKLFLWLSVVVHTGFASAEQDLSAFNAAAPRSILVVPIVNISLDVNAPNYLLTTLTYPLAEKGYYVFPVNTVKFVLEQEGFYEAEEVHRQPPEALAKLFGADAVLYATIKRWDLQGLIVTGTATVDLEYRMVSKDGIEIWQSNKKMRYDAQSNILTSLVAGALSDPITHEHKMLTAMVNATVFMVGPNAIPNGPYLKGK